MEQKPNKALGFLFVRSAKDSGKKFITGHIDLPNGEKLELVAHFAAKKDKNGNPFLYVFEREPLETKGVATQSTAPVKAKKGDDPF
jgi:hypothetical protein